ncbi:unnamed protein product, partial [Amoebophrya sp. A25]
FLGIFEFFLVEYFEKFLFGAAKETNDTQQDGESITGGSPGECSSFFTWEAIQIGGDHHGGFSGTSAKENQKVCTGASKSKLV